MNDKLKESNDFFKDAYVFYAFRNIWKKLSVLQKQF